MDFDQVKIGQKYWRLNSNNQLDEYTVVDKAEIWGDRLVFYRSEHLEGYGEITVGDLFTPEQVRAACAAAIAKIQATLAQFEREHG